MAQPSGPLRAGLFLSGLCSGSLLDDQEQALTYAQPESLTHGATIAATTQQHRSRIAAPRSCSMLRIGGTSLTRPRKIGGRIGYLVKIPQAEEEPRTARVHYYSETGDPLPARMSLAAPYYRGTHPYLRRFPQSNLFLLRRVFASVRLGNCGVVGISAFAFIGVMAGPAFVT